MGEEVVKREDIGYDVISIVVSDFIVEPRVWEWEGVLRYHSLFDLKL